MPNQTDHLWSKKQVAQYLGITTRTVDRWDAADPAFPKSRRISKYKRWLASEIIRYSQGGKPLSCKTL
jgi:predicted DNA-binding transcriptional regulator AlpA